MSQPQTKPQPPAIRQRFKDFDHLIDGLTANIVQLEDTRRRHVVARQSLADIVSAYDDWVPPETREERLERAVRVLERAVDGEEPDADLDEDFYIPRLLPDDGPHARFLFKNQRKFADPPEERLAIAAARYCDWIFKR